MLYTGEYAKDIFREVEQIQISDIHHQAHGYFRMLGIGNVVNQVISNPLVVSAIQKLDSNVQEVQMFMTGCSQI